MKITIFLLILLVIVLTFEGFYFYDANQKAQLAIQALQRSQTELSDKIDQLEREKAELMRELETRIAATRKEHSK